MWLIQYMELLVHSYYNPQRVLVSMVILMFRSQWRGGAGLEARRLEACLLERLLRPEL